MSRLTKKLVESAEITAKDRIIFDDELPGFGLRILPSGRKSFILQYRHGRQPRRMNIGPYPIVTAEDARIEATKLLGAIRSGEDPMGKKLDYHASPTVDDLAKRFLHEHCKAHLKPSSYAFYEKLLNDHILPKLGNQKVVDITRTHIANLHSQLSFIPTTANRALAVLSKMFSLAELWGWRADNTNPARKIKKYPEKKKERYLSKEETISLGIVLEEQKRYPDENLAAIYAIQLLLLTGCRKNEILKLKWSYFNQDQGCLMLPDSKTGAKTIYLGAPAISLLHEIKNHPARPTNNPYVIWGKKDDAHLVNIRTPWLRFRKLAGLENEDLENVRIHDLRHSFGSMAASGSRLSLPMIGKLLGHKNVETTARYAHLMSDPMKEAAESVSAQIGALMAIPKYAPPPAAVHKTRATAQILTFIPKTNIPMPVYLTSDQAAHYLGLPPESMKDWRYRKLGPRFTKVANRVRYSQADLDEYLQMSSNRPVNTISGIATRIAQK